MSLDKLYAIIEKRRKTGSAETSYTAKLIKRGRKKICQKIGEEASEVIIDAVAKDREGVVKESADLLFHLTMLWSAMGIRPKEIFDELQARETMSGLEEKAKRKGV